MEKLFEHTLQQQVAKQSEEIGSLKDQIAELTSLLKNSAVLSPTGSNNNNTTINTVNSNNMVNNGVQLYQTINIAQWGGEFYISAQMLEMLFAENETLQRFGHIGVEGRTDPEEAAPYVQEALKSLVKQQHRDPQQRNVYLNPKRHDQVLVFEKVHETGEWRVLSLVEAIRSMFDRIARGISRATVLTGTEWQKLSPAVQESAAWITVMYGEQREQHIIKAKGAMAAHLANMIPGKESPQIIAKEPVEKQDREEQKVEQPLPLAKPVVSQKAAEKAVQQAFFTVHDAVALLRATKPKRGESRLDYAKRLLAGAKDQEPGRIMGKLWEALNDGELAEDEARAVQELVSEHDAGKLVLE